MFKNIYTHLFAKQTIFLIIIGSIPGAILRWQFNNDVFVNVFGSAFLGLILGLNVNRNIQLLLAVGFCGSFTTFSGWIGSVLELILNGLFLQAFVLTFFTLLAGFFALTLGFMFGKRIRYSFHP